MTFLYEQQPEKNSCINGRLWFCHSPKKTNTERVGSYGINFHCRAGSEIQRLQMDAGVKWGSQNVEWPTATPPTDAVNGSLAFWLWSCHSLNAPTQQSTSGDWSHLLTPVGQQFRAYRWMLKWRGLKFQALIPSLPKNLESARKWGVMAPTFLAGNENYLTGPSVMVWAQWNCLWTEGTAVAGHGSIVLMLWFCHSLNTKLWANDYLHYLLICQLFSNYYQNSWQRILFWLACGSGHCCERVSWARTYVANMLQPERNDIGVWTRAQALLHN